MSLADIKQQMNDQKRAMLFAAAKQAEGLFPVVSDLFQNAGVITSKKQLQGIKDEVTAKAAEVAEIFDFLLTEAECLLPEK